MPLGTRVGSPYVLAGMEQARLSSERVVGFEANGGFSVKGGSEAMVHLMSEARPPTAVFALSDEMAMGAIKAAKDLGLRVPEDISLVGYDNTAVAALRHIDLTTIDQPREAMGRTAVDLLLERLHPDVSVRSPPSSARCVTSTTATAWRA